MKKRVISFCFIVLFMLTTGCGGKNEENKLVGTYKWNEQDTNDYLQFIFKEDGSFSDRNISNYAIEQDEQYKILDLYNDSEDELSSSGMGTYIIKEEANSGEYRLVLYFNQKETEVTINLVFKSGEDGLAGDTLFDGEYACKEDSKPVTYHFKKDGTMDVTMDGTYEVSGDKLKLGGKDGTTDYTYELSEDGENLTILGENDLKMEFVKEKNE